MLKWPCVCTICDLYTLSGRSKHHIRSIHSALKFNGIALLKRIPQTHRDFLFLCSFHRKSATTLYLNRIAIAQHRMLYAECMYMISVHLKIFILLIELYAFYLKRQLRRNRPKCSDNPCKPLRSNNGKRLGALGISHGKKKPRQSADMVCMKVGDA